MSELLWFHAFGHGMRPKEFLRILYDGLRPKAGSQTQKWEDALDISPHCVYFYLGIADKGFGTTGLALPFSDVRGWLSPFDSGMLVEAHKPICERTPAEKVVYLNAATFPTARAPELIAKHPGAQLADYLDGKRPPHEGPHEHWPSIPAAPLWRENGWKAWLWEARVPNGTSVRTLVQWTCPGEDFDEAVEVLETTYSHDPVWVKAMFDCHFNGGVGPMWDALRDRQLAP